ncbi:hypothetical protein [Luteimonas aquatica]|uniref:hypothetical protein n=1 Tax=Luteimonas aquatica TaxID=450364 RepID=UPI001F56E5FE|nr:hypothetical protein [Luteimonas aquatica]
MNASGTTSGEGGTARTQWWLATLGRTIVWARLQVREAGTATVLDSDGNTLVYDSEDSARAALMDAEFVAFDGLDEEDALARGFAPGEIQPPQARDDAQLRERMVQRLGSRA